MSEGFSGSATRKHVVDSAFAVLFLALPVLFGYATLAPERIGLSAAVGTPQIVVASIVPTPMPARPPAAAIVPPAMPSAIPSPVATPMPEAGLTARLRPLLSAVTQLGGSHAQHEVFARMLRYAQKRCHDAETVVA